MNRARLMQSKRRSVNRRLRERPGRRHLFYIVSLLCVSMGLGLGTASGAIRLGPITNPANSHIYYLLSAQTWSNSEVEAVSLGGHLVTISDSNEQTWVWTTFSPHSPYLGQLWIGLSDFAQRYTYAWSSGASLTYTNWSPGEPSFQSGGVPERCVHMWEQYGGQWNDAPAAYNKPCGVVEILPQPPLLNILTAVELRWISLSNQTYQVQSSTNMVDWSDFGDPIATPAGTTNQVFDSMDTQKKFYQLVVPTTW